MFSDKEDARHGDGEGGKPRADDHELRRLDKTASLSGLLPDGMHASLKDLSEWGARVVTPHSPDLTLGEVMGFRLCRDEQRVLVECSARVMGLAELEQGAELILWIVSEAGRWREVVRRYRSRVLNSHWHHYPAPSTNLQSERVAPRLKALCLDHARALVRSLATPDGLALPARLDSERGLLLEWDPSWSLLEPPFEIQVEGPFSTVKFLEQTLRWSGPPAPPRATVIRRRQLRRVLVPSGSRVVLAGVGDTALEIPMLDVSFGGVGALIGADTALELQPGVEVPEVIVTWRGGPGLRFIGEVRHRSPVPNSTNELLGLRLYGAPEDQRERWAREVETLLYPITRSYGHDYESIWNLFEESGYFDISECLHRSSDFQQLRNAFENAYRKIETAPHLGCLAAYESPTRVEATISGLRAWGRSWFGTQLARNPVRPHIAHSDSGPLRQIIFHVYERAGANTDLEWLVHYVRDDAPSFSQELFRDLVLSMPGACGVPFEVWKFKVTMLGDWTAPNVYPASRTQVDEVLAKLRPLRPVPYLEALDLLPETFDQEELRVQWRMFGLERERAMYVATEHGKIVAAALLETVEEGLHVYSLLDGVRLFELEPGGRNHFGALLVAANEWFYTMGKSTFVGFDEDDYSTAMESAGGESMGSAVATFLPRHATTELLERVAEMTVPKHRI